MKQYTACHFRIFSFSLLVLLILFSSCDTYNFSQPQPVDQENLYEFPDVFLGRWFSEDEDSTEFYQINKKNIQVIINEKREVVKGAWPRLNEQGKLIYAPFNFLSVHTIIYDSVNKPLDTVPNYLFNENKIYEINENRFLGKGYSYKTVNDTVHISKKDTLFIDLGQNAFLKKLNDEYYVLNIRNSILGKDFSRVSDWWQLIVLQVVNHQRVNRLECSSGINSIPCMFYNNSVKSAIYHFNCSFSSAEMLHMIQKDYFELSSKLHK